MINDKYDEQIISAIAESEEQNSYMGSANSAALLL
jgi:hypothetical protein